MPISTSKVSADHLAITLEKRLFSSISKWLLLVTSLVTKRQKGLGYRIYYRSPIFLPGNSVAELRVPVIHGHVLALILLFS